MSNGISISPAWRRGVADALLRALIASTGTAGIWTIQSGIFPENVASLRLHERQASAASASGSGSARSTHDGAM